MTEHGTRTGAARDVPPPRPVGPSATAAPVEETPLGRAARAVADAVAGLIGALGRAAPPPPKAPPPTDDGRPPRACGTSSVRSRARSASAFAPGRGEGTAPPPADGDRAPSALLGDLLSAVAPRLSIRDAARLRQAHPGASDEAIAEALVERAARVTSAIGAAAGGLSATHWLLPASLLALPLELGAETVLIGAVEVVLIGELHELHGRAPVGDTRSRASAYLHSWSEQRAVDGAGAAALGSLLGIAGLGAVRRAMSRKLLRSVPTAAPFLIGAAIAGRGNRRATETLARRVLTDLRSPGARGPQEHDHPAGTLRLGRACAVSPRARLGSPSCPNCPSWTCRSG